MSLNSDHHIIVAPFFSRARTSPSSAPFSPTGPRRRSMALTQEGRNTETQLPSEHPFDIRFQVWVSPAAAGLLREPRRPGGAAPTPPLSTPVARAAGCSNSRSEASSRMLQQQMGGQGHGETMAVIASVPQSDSRASRAAGCCSSRSEASITMLCALRVTPASPSCASVRGTSKMAPQQSGGSSGSDSGSSGSDSASHS